MFFAKRGVNMVKRVLLVDDNPVVVKTLRELFTHESDFEVCGEAENGRDAIEKAQQLNPDLIVTDFSMPIMNGLEETRLLKQLMPNLPVIIYTAYSDPFIEKELRAAGASAVIPKSAAVATLKTKARCLLNEMAA
jgi:DNA-binding NarL/FixJ family response regulator